MANSYYIREVKESVLDWIRENYEEKEIGRKLRDREDWEETLNDELFNNDSVTGNASGSFFFNRWKSKDAFFESYDEDCGTEINDMISEFGINMDEHWDDWEYLDVSMRCYSLGSAISEALDELEEECEDEEELIYIKDDLRTAIKEIRAKFEYANHTDGVDYSETIYFFEDGSIEVGYMGASWVAYYDLYLSDIEGNDDEILMDDIIKNVTADNENICFD